MRLTIKAKLATTFVVVVAMSAVGMFMGIQNLGALNDSLDNIVQGNVQRVQIANDINARSVRVVRDEKNLILTSNDADFQTFADRIETEKAAIAEQSKKLYDLSGELGKPRVEAFTAAWDAFLVQHDEVKRLAGLHSNIKAADAIKTAGALQKDALTSLREMEGRLETSVVTGTAEPAVIRAYTSLKSIDPQMLEISRDVRNVVISMVDPEAQKADIAGLGERQQALLAAIDAAAGIVPASERNAFANYRQQVDTWLAGVNTARDLAVENSDYYATVLTNGAAADARRASIEAMDAVIALNNEQMNQASLDATALYEQSRMLLIALLIGSALIAGIAATWIVISITRALNGAIGLATEVAGGNLSATANVNSDDEVGDLVKTLNTMTGKLRDVVGEVTAATRNVAAGSQEMSATAEQLSQGATEQALLDRGGVGLDGRNGRDHQAVGRQRQPDREDRPPVRGRCHRLG